MTFIKLLVTLFALSSTFGSAFTVAISNQATAGDPSLPIIFGQAGGPLVTGTVAVGYFNADQDVTNNSSDYFALLSAFNEYGSSGSFSNGFAPSLFSMFNPLHWTIDVPIGSTAPQVGKNVYVVIGSGSSLMSSKHLAVWKSAAIFGTEDDAGNGGVFVALETGQGSLLLGSLNGSTVITASGGPSGPSLTYSNSIGLAAPEPSSVLLIAVSALGFGLRRRRG